MTWLTCLCLLQGGASYERTVGTLSPQRECQRTGAIPSAKATLAAAAFLTEGDPSTEATLAAAAFLAEGDPSGKATLAAAPGNTGGGLGLCSAPCPCPPAASPAAEAEAAPATVGSDEPAPASESPSEHDGLLTSHMGPRGVG